MPKRKKIEDYIEKLSDEESEETWRGWDNKKGHKAEPESFEKTEYEKSENSEDIYDVYKTIKQLTDEQARDFPNMACGVNMTNGKLKIYFNDYEVGLPAKINAVKASANDILNNFVKYLKKEYKSRAGKVLNLKEFKDLAGCQIEKISLNDRYRYLAWRVFEIT
jgi:hypothetical protein